MRAYMGSAFSSLTMNVNIRLIRIVGPVPRTGLPSRLRDEGIGPYIDIQHTGILESPIHIRVNRIFTHESQTGNAPHSLLIIGATPAERIQPPR